MKEPLWNGRLILSAITSDFLKLSGTLKLLCVQAKRLDGRGVR